MKIVLKQINYKIQNTRTNCFALEVTTNIWKEYDLKSDKI